MENGAEGSDFPKLPSTVLPNGHPDVTAAQLKHEEVERVEAVPPRVRALGSTHWAHNRRGVPRTKGARRDAWL